MCGPIKDQMIKRSDLHVSRIGITEMQGALSLSSSDFGKMLASRRHGEAIRLTHGRANHDVCGKSQVTDEPADDSTLKAILEHEKLEHL